LRIEPDPRPIRELLAGAESPHERVRAVMALRNMDARKAVPLLRLAFAHESEDVRLLAFAILDRREKRLRSRIKATETHLQAAQGAPKDKQLRWHRRLARDHWELVYGGFVSGDLEPVVLGKAREHAHTVLETVRDARMGLLIARIYLRERDAEAAWECLEQAEEAGAPRASVVPLFAEAAFQLRRFEQIPGILLGAKPAELRRPELQPIARFWTERSSA
jgi:polysaccharide biosynthesis protein PelE